MSTADARTAPAAFDARMGQLKVLLDETTGLPVAVAEPPSGAVAPVSFRLELEVNGQEVPDVMGGLTYRETERHELQRLVPGSVEHVTSGPEETYSFEADAGDWRVRCLLTVRPEHPRLELRVAVSPKAGLDGAALLRDLRLTAVLRPEDLERWCVEAPGNMLRTGVRAADVAEEVTVLSAGHELGSPGLVALHRADDPVTLIIWPFSKSEREEITLEPIDDGLAVQVRTQLAGAVRPGEWLEHGPIYLDVLGRPWSDVRRELKGWYGSMGLFTPVDRPAWAAGLSIFEVMVGSAPFYGGQHYCPYPTLQDLIADLDRIAELGFGCLQLMPRHPYPSYNIHAPGDIATTYGDPDELRQLIAACHDRGLRLILDILLHGVIDREVMARTAELVKQGPFVDRLGDPCSDPYDFTSVEISWSRHILEFAPYWLEGSPEHHPLLDEHPDWFMRSSAGEVTGVYTHALDIANEDWQDHFVDGCVAMVEQLGIDGFRFDAPLYNRFANWSEPTRRHASYSSLGALRLLRKLRRRLRALSEDLLLHTEPGGPLLRESLDLNYCYQERWLIPSLFDRDGAERHEWRRVRTGKELAAWCRDFDAAMPERSLTAHFVDCHDTMWWRLPGDFWRREQIGLEATKAVVAIYALRGGCYMTFVGGEEGIEAELQTLHALRRQLPEIRDGGADYEAVAATDDAVYAVLRRSGDRAAIVAVNVSSSALHCRLEAQVAGVARDAEGWILDAWSGEWVRAADNAGAAVRVELELAPYQTRVLVLSEPPAALAARPRP